MGAVDFEGVGHGSSVRFMKAHPLNASRKKLNN